MSDRKYIRPGSMMKVVNPVITKLGFAWELTVRGRKSGEPRSVAVTPIEIDGVTYLVGARGETDWVRNLRAAGEGELRRRGERQRFRAVELTGDEQTKLAQAYRDKLGRAVAGYFEQLPDPADHPVFRVERV